MSGAARKNIKLERNSRNILKRLQSEGWELVRTKGSHHLFKHPDKDKLITLPHPKKDLPEGTVRQIYEFAGWL